LTRRSHCGAEIREPDAERKAPNPGGGVGREKRVMRMVPGGNPAPQAMSFG
jgi:hypothetical protein